MATAGPSGGRNGHRAPGNEPDGRAWRDRAPPPHAPEPDRGSAAMQVATWRRPPSGAHSGHPASDMHTFRELPAAPTTFGHALRALRSAPISRVRGEGRCSPIRRQESRNTAKAAFSVSLTARRSMTSAASRVPAPPPRTGPACGSPMGTGGVNGGISAPSPCRARCPEAGGCTRARDSRRSPRSGRAPRSRHAASPRSRRRHGRPPAGRG